MHEMFHSRKYEHPRGSIEMRTEILTGIRSRICPERLKRGIGVQDLPEYGAEGCPFCPDLITEVTPVFPDGTRLIIGESTTFPNLYPFAAYHVVTVMTRDHMVRFFTEEQLKNALIAQCQALKDHTGYASINWNFLPSAGASLPHPHLQGLVDPVPDTLLDRYLSHSRMYYRSHGRSWWNDLRIHEKNSMRYLDGLHLFWYAHPVPIGEKEIRCILPGVTVTDFEGVIDMFSEDLKKILDFYQDLGHSAWNMSIFFAQEEERDYFSSFAILIARINPNSRSTSDTAFMERLHLEPVVLTLPEDLGGLWQDNNQNK